VAGNVRFDKVPHCGKVKNNKVVVQKTTSYLLQDEVELGLCLVYLVSLQQTEVSSAQQMARVVHDDLVCRGVQERGLQ